MAPWTLSRSGPASNGFSRMALTRARRSGRASVALGFPVTKTTGGRPGWSCPTARASFHPDSPGISTGASHSRRSPSWPPAASATRNPAILTMYARISREGESSSITSTRRGKIPGLGSLSRRRSLSLSLDPREVLAYSPSPTIPAHPCSRSGHLDARSGYAPDRRGQGLAGRCPFLLEAAIPWAEAVFGSRTVPPKLLGARDHPPPKGPHPEAVALDRVSIRSASGPLEVGTPGLGDLERGVFEDARKRLTGHAGFLS